MLDLNIPEEVKNLCVEEAKSCLAVSPPIKCPVGSTLDTTEIVKTEFDTSEYKPDGDNYVTRVTLSVKCDQCKYGHDFNAYTVREKATHKLLRTGEVDKLFPTYFGGAIATWQPKAWEPQ